LPTISNLQFSDFLKLHIERFIRTDKIGWLIMVRASVKNWYDYYFVRLGLEKSKDLKLKMGGSILANHESFDEVLAVIHPPLDNHAIMEPVQDGYMIKLKNGYQFFVRKRSETFPLYETFLKEQYKNLKVDNKLVIDVGANIGDSAIYFSKRAKEVIAFEPYPYSYNLAKTNLVLNHAWNVKLLNKALGEKNTAIKLDPSYSNMASDQIKESTDGVTVDVVTLHDVINTYGVESAVLKIDCEGCEYGLILSSTAQDLRKFDEIIVECHYGYVNIENKLESAGFKTRHTAISYIHNPRASPQHMCINFVFATRSRIKSHLENS
jgi:FkbM family methyltransferase